MADVVISVQRNGPYYITGTFKLLDTAGEEYELEGEETSLCRCGGSSTKPFCDDTHITQGFRDACRKAQKLLDE